MIARILSVAQDGIVRYDKDDHGIHTDHTTEGTRPCHRLSIAGSHQPGKFCRVGADRKRSLWLRHARPVIDLSKIETLSSIGVRALVIVHKLLSTDGMKHLKLSGLSSSMRDVLEIAGITQFIDVYDTVEEAVASF